MSDNFKKQDSFKRHISTQEQNSETENIVKTMIKTIETNKGFSKLIIYALNNLKSYLIIPVENQSLEYSSIILKSNEFKNNENVFIDLVFLYIINQSFLTIFALFIYNLYLDNFIEIIQVVLRNHLNNEELLIKVGDVLVNLITQNNRQKETIKLFTSRSGFDILTYIFDKVDTKMTEVYKIFIKVVKLVIDDKSYKYDKDLDHMINLLFTKFEDNEEIVVF